MTGKQLKNSILQLAIQGKLVPQDPHDEPASELLKRIRKEKEQLVKTGKLKKKDFESTPITDDEKPFEIPESWEWCRVMDIIDLRDGTHDSPQYVEKGYPLITSKDFDGDRFCLDKTKYISEKDYLSIIQRSKVDVGDILFSMIGGNIGNQIIITEDNYFDMAIKNVALYKQYNKNLLNNRYVYIFLLASIGRYQAIAAGGAQSFVALKTLRNDIFPLPPLSEQHRIVEKIEELMPLVEEYDKAQSELDKLNESLPEQLKKSILQQAIMGKLVPQDPNDEPASELLKRIRKEKENLVKLGALKKKDLITTPISEEEKSFDIPESWEWCRLEDVLEFVNGRAYKKEELLPDGKYKVLRVGNLFTNESWYYSNLELDDTKYCYDGDLLYAWSASFGPHIWKGEKTIFHYHIWNIKYSSENSFREYLYYFLLNDVNIIKQSTTGSTMIHVSMENMKPRLIPLPPLSEQHRIVAKIEELFNILK